MPLPLVSIYFDTFVCSFALALSSPSVMSCRFGHNWLCRVCLGDDPVVPQGIVLKHPFCGQDEKLSLEDEATAKVKAAAEKAKQEV